MSDRFHATIVDTNTQLRECMLYVDLNMVRAGVVAHPEEWIYGGYYHIHCKKRRMALVDEQLAQSYLGFNKMESFKKEYLFWINHALQRENLNRDKKWTESVAVGSESFLKTVIKHFEKSLLVKIVFSPKS